MARPRVRGLPRSSRPADACSRLRMPNSVRPWRPPTEGSRTWLLLVEYCLGLDVDGDLVADDDAAALDRGVPADPEVVPVDDGGRAEAQASATPRVVPETADLDLQGDRLGDAADREVAVDQEVIAVRPDAGRPERQLGVGLDLEEVAAPQVVVALLRAGRDGRQLDLGLGVGVERVRRGLDGARELLELAANLGHHQVPCHEADLGVGRVEVPGSVAVSRDSDSSGHVLRLPG